MRAFPKDEKTVLIDTNRYAGNFEREMVAFITGQVGDCGVGREMADLAEKQLTKRAWDWFVDNISPQPDEHGCWRPASIAALPGSDDYNSVEFCVHRWPPDDIQKVIVERAQRFGADYKEYDDTPSPIEIKSVRMVERTVAESLRLRLWPDQEGPAGARLKKTLVIAHETIHDLAEVGTGPVLERLAANYAELFDGADINEDAKEWRRAHEETNQ